VEELGGAGEGEREESCGLFGLGLCAAGFLLCTELAGGNKGDQLWIAATVRYCCGHSAPPLSPLASNKQAR
jgi:hypothetical protein